MAEPYFDRQNYPLVLMFSGGLDSYILWKLYKPDRVVTCDLQHRYRRKETTAISQLVDVDIELREKDRLITDYRLHLGDVEQGSGYIPMRNLFLAMIGSLYGERVMMGTTLGESSRDKDSKFLRNTNKLLKHLYGRTWGNDKQKIDIVFPARYTTKATLVKKYLEAGYPASALNLTVSCYHETKWRCGECNACFRRWVAMRLNGIQEDYDVHPAEAYKARQTKMSLYKQAMIYGIRDTLVTIPNNWKARQALKLYETFDKRDRYRKRKK